MAEFRVDTDQLKGHAGEIRQLQGELNAVALKLTGVQLGSVLQVKASTALVGAVSSCKWAAINQSYDLGRLATGLENVAGAYVSAEKKLIEPEAQKQAEQIGVSGAENLESFWDIIETLIGWLGKKSVPFSLIAALNSFVGGDSKGIVSGLKNLLYAIGNGTKAIINTSEGVQVDWVKMLGFNDQGVSGLGDSWQKFWEGMNLSKQTTTAGKVATVCKWAGYVLTFVSEGIDNFKEHGEDWSNSRFLGETIIESATSIGLSISAGVLVAAALPASAPAIIVGVVSAGVVWLGDEVCDYLTGQDIGEWVSDLVYGDGKVAEVKEWIEDQVEDIGKAAQELGEDIISGVGKTWDAACDWVGALFG